MSEDRTNAARQARYQARKKAEFEALKLKVAEYESKTLVSEVRILPTQIMDANGIDNPTPFNESSIRANERERCAKFCEGGTTHQPAGRLLAAGIRMLK